MLPCRLHGSIVVMRHIHYHVLQGLSEFLLQAICTRSGELRALLVLGHADAKPFEHHAEWHRLHELLDVMLFAAVHASSLASYVAFAELLQLMPSEADTVMFLSHWLPPLLVGADCCINNDNCVCAAGNLVNSHRAYAIMMLWMKSAIQAAQVQSMFGCLSRGMGKHSGGRAGSSIHSKAALHSVQGDGASARDRGRCVN